jgi:hypothetical protein
MSEKKFFREDMVVKMLDEIKAKYDEGKKKYGDRVIKLWQESAEISKDAQNDLGLLLVYLFMSVSDDYIEQCLKMISSEVAINTAKQSLEIARDITEGT